MSLPSYDDLPVDPTKPPRSAWGLWGDDDQLGTINLLDRSCVRRGLACAKQGIVFSLNWKLEQPDPPLHGRAALRHNLVPIHDFALDDSYDCFFPQGSSQWDALCHVGHPEYGYYNGWTRDDFTGKPGTRNGVEHWARRGIVGRGILLDVARYLASVGRESRSGETVEFSVEDLEATRQASGVTYETGDILLVRTGWMNWYEQLPTEAREGLAYDASAKLECPGLSADADMVRYLWDSHFAAVATDNSTFEAWPHEFEVGKYLHFELLPLLGMPIGELWHMEALAEDCAQDGVYEFLLTSAPLNKLGGVGSPPNALAIK